MYAKLSPMYAKQGLSYLLCMQSKFLQLCAWLSYNEPHVEVRAVSRTLAQLPGELRPASSIKQSHTRVNQAITHGGYRQNVSDQAARSRPSSTNTPNCGPRLCREVSPVNCRFVSPAKQNARRIPAKCRRIVTPQLACRCLRPAAPHRARLAAECGPRLPITRELAPHRAR